MADSKVGGLVQVLQALIPNLGGISPTPLPIKAAYPYVTVQKIGGVELESLGGRSGFYPSMMQVNCFDIDYDSADLMREAIKDALMPIGGPSYSGPAGTLTIAGINHQNDAEIYDAEREVHQCVTRLQVVWVSN